MLFPSRESEKAISGYSVYLKEALKKNKINANAITYKAGSPLSFLRILSKLKKYDIIHLQHEYNLLGYYGLPFFLLYFLLSFYKCKIITTMHTVLSQKEKFKGNFIKNSFRKLLYFFQNRLINSISDYIIVHAHFFKDILVKEYRFSENKISILPQGIIDNIKTIPKNKAKKKLNLLGPVYLIIGNLTSDSGVDVILKQSGKIGKTILVVSSPTPVNDRRKLRLRNYLSSNIKFIKEMGFSKYVRFDIKLINDEKPEWWIYFSAADLVLQPYRGGIGSGIFTHAMATKKPVIASNILFFREISKNYGCVKIAEKEQDYSKVIKKAMKPANYKKMVKECERYLKENSWSEISKKYKKLYNSFYKIKQS